MDGPHGSDCCTASVDYRDNVLQAWDPLCDKNIIHMTSCSKYQGVNDLCQKADQTGEESFKLGKKEQVRGMVVTHILLKRLWTGLVEGTE